MTGGPSFLWMTPVNRVDLTPSAISFLYFSNSLLVVNNLLLIAVERLLHETPILLFQASSQDYFFQGFKHSVAFM